MSYATEHAGALADIREAGAAVTFERTVTDYDEETGVTTQTTTEVSGSAIRTKGNPLRYQVLGLVASEAPSLLFAADAFGETPKPGDRVAWSGTTYTVRDVEPLAPDGTAILSKVIVAR